MITFLLLAALAQDKLAPYSGVRWTKDAPEVELDGAWVGLVSIDGLKAADIVAWCKTTYGERRWKKRFEEDLVEVMTGMGHPPGATVRLEIRSGGETRTRAGVPMTKENRRKIWAAARDPLLPRAALEADLDELRAALEARYAYLKLRKVDLGAAVEAAKGRLGDGLRREAFALEVARILALFQDGHTRPLEEPSSGRFLPFLVGDAGGKLVAFEPDRSRFVDPERPFLKAIDGRHVSGPVRRLRDLGPGPDILVRVELASAGGDAKVHELPVIPTQPIYGEWPRGGHRRMGDLGYLRIPRMDEGAGLDEAMAGFHDTKGLIIDVRGNGGGSRVILTKLFPYFMAPGEIRVANVAAPRGAEDLGDRDLFPLDSPRWTPEERTALERFAAGFKPEWALPAGDFGVWHYFALRPGTRRCEKPVVVLMDGDCYSATDIFLGAFKGWRNVTLMGTSSGGGSGRPRPLQLRNSGVALQMSSMASFRPDGSLYEGKGVAPDIVVHAEPTDFLGRTDAPLKAAVDLLLRGGR